jgi:hypothetical protein
MRNRSLGSTVLAAALFSAGPTRASDPTAEALYREGRAAAQAQDYRLACEKFRESQRREPAPGTLLNLADCEEKQGLWTASMAHFRAAERGFRANDERIPYARERASALDARIPKLTLRFAPDAEATSVSLDGAPIAEPSAPLRVDPGEHTVVATSPTRGETRLTISVREGEARVVDLPPSSAAAVPAPMAEPQISQERRPPREGSRLSLPTPALVAFGLAGAGLVVGVGTGAAALDTASDVRRQCPGRLCTSQESVDDASRGRTFATVSTVGFLVAIAGAAVGTYFVLRPTSKTNVAPASYGGSPGLSLSGEL